MKKKETKTLPKAKKLEILKAGALLTNKPHRIEINKSTREHFGCDAFVATVKPILPAGHDISVAVNTTGKGETLRVRDALGQEVERIFFPSSKIKYNGFGFGQPQLRRMAEVLNVPASTLCAVRQGSKKYWFNEDMTLLSSYFSKKYGKDSK